MAAAAPPADATMSAAAAPPPEPHDTKPTTEHVAKPASALTPPTSEEMNHDAKQENEESDLSDLEDMDDDDDEEIFPDHYWDGENGGKIPVFKPTMEQFRSFKKFVDKINKYGMKSGIVKVIPPPEWRNSLPALDDSVKRIRIKNPITQEFNGTFGTYTQQNVEKQRSYNLPEWKALTEETQHQHPARRGERRRNQEKVVRGGGSLRGRTSTANVAVDDEEDGAKNKKKPGRPRRNPAPAPPPEPESDHEPKRKSRRTKEPARASPPPEKSAKKPRGRPPAKGGQAKSVTSRRLNNTSEAVDLVDEKAFKHFDYRMDGLDEYTPERCAELETHYWKSLGFNQPMYAADMPGSLFDDSDNSWNVAKLENLLDILGTKVPGVNTAYLYMGMWKATFAWHLEDVDLYSINYIHFGAPKQWYSISQEDARKFERAMKTVWPVDAKNCDQFLRHKTYLISPDVLQKQYGVKVNKLVHYEGEFVITYPYGYHSGYNIGYNCAESVNFATESWMEFGRIARKCNCEADNVWVDVSEIERKLRGEPTPEYYEETDDDEDEHDDEDDGNLPTPPASVKGQKTKTKKRKREVKQEAPKKKKKIRIKIRTATREPCCMCPNDNPWDPLLPADGGKKAHRSCAMYTPETFLCAENGKEKVGGVANIDKARLDLKCNFCRSKRGACFQCSSKKCTRAFHASCAVAAGVLVDAGRVPTFGEDGTEYFEEGYDFRCRYHRPKMPKIVHVDALENSKRINSYAKELKPNDTVQAQLIGTEVFGGLVIENRPSEMSLVVDVLPDGNRVEIEWKWLCVLDPDDSLRPKPSASALPMPENMNKSKFSMANRQDGVPTQHESFHTDATYKWHDFYNMHMPPPGYQTVQLHTIGKLAVNVDKPDQLYHYIPELSTESKPCFTEKIGSMQIAPKAIFADRVSAAVRPVTYRPSTYTTAIAQQPIAKQPLAPAVRPTGTGYISNQAQLNSAAAGARNDKPYIYKPKEPAKPDQHCAVDYRSLAAQHNFLAEGSRRMSQFSLPQPQQQYQAYGYQGSDPSRNAAPIRSFPPDQYYSSRTLPAAWPGDYSRYRRESQGAHTMERPSFEDIGYTPNYQSVSQQTNQMRQGTVPHMGGNPNADPVSIMGNPNAIGYHSRPPSSAQSHQSPTGVPLTPATTMSSISKPGGPPTDLGFINNLQNYPYLMNSYCRKPKVYQSPYSIGGGFANQYQPLELQKQEEEDTDTKPSRHTPRNSVTPLTDAIKSEGQDWTPPSQRPGVLKQTPPPQPPSLYDQPGLRYVHAIHSTPQEFQRQISGGIPSTASRDGAQARMLRDQGFPQFPPTNGQQQQRNSFGQPYDTARMWNSPQAPTPSPLSDPNTPGFMAGSNPALANSGGGSGGWGMLPRTDGAQVGQRPQVANNNNGYGAGYGPMLPQMHGGNEAWRYN